MQFTQPLRQAGKRTVQIPTQNQESEAHDQRCLDQHGGQGTAPEGGLLDFDETRVMKDRHRALHGPIRLNRKSEGVDGLPAEPDELSA